MDFITFSEANRALGAPQGMSPEQCGTLPVYADGRQCISCWQPTEAERDAIAAGLPVYLGVLVSADPDRPAYSQPPVFVTVGKPDMPPVVHTPSEQMLRALEYIASLLPPAGAVAQGLRSVEELLAEEPDLRQRDGQPLDLAKLGYFVEEASQFAHYAALLEAYRQHGQPGVVAYLQPYEAFLPQEVITLA